MQENEVRINAEEHRIGVVLCKCGGLISSQIDMTAFTQKVNSMPRVAFTAFEDYPCSPDGQERLRKVILDRNLDRILIAGCAPRLVEKLFQTALHPAGFSPDQVTLADIREGSVYVHAKDPDGMLHKALTMVEMGVSHLDHSSPIYPHSGEVTRSALIIGSDLSALTVALALAEQEIPVTLAEAGDQIGTASTCYSPEVTRLTQERVSAVLAHPFIQIMLNTRLVSLGGHPGRYEVWLRQRGQINTKTVGAVVVANRGQPKSLSAEHWIDRSRVKSLQEFEQELEQARRSSTSDLNQVVFFFCAEESQHTHCSRVCCNIGIRQALQVKKVNPDANVTILFRDLYLGDQGEAALARARQAGVTFFRYRKEAPPVIGNSTVDVQDLFTGIPIQLPYQRLILTTSMTPDPELSHLATLLDLPLDELGFLAEPRLRLRPGRYTDPGVYVLGSKQMPSGTTEAIFQAYLTAARALRLLDQAMIQVNTPVAEINPNLCTGCGTCPQVCPVDAIHLEQSDGILSLSKVDDLRCIGCGNCAVVCPVKAITMPGWNLDDIPAQIIAALDPMRFSAEEPRVLVMACEWSAFAASETAGHQQIQYPSCARLMRMNCSARFDPFHVLWAFLNGADGVLLGACPPGECHYGMGNLYARERLALLQHELAFHGIDPNRLRLEYFKVNEGEKFAQVVNQFVHDLRTHLAVDETAGGALVTSS